LLIASLQVSVGAGIAIAETSREVVRTRGFMLRTSGSGGEAEEQVKMTVKNSRNAPLMRLIHSDGMWMLANLWGFISFHESTWVSFLAHNG